MNDMRRLTDGHVEISTNLKETMMNCGRWWIIVLWEVDKSYCTGCQLKKDVACFKMCKLTFLM